MKEVIEIVRKERRPFIVHAKVPLLGHHTSGVRKEWYRNDLDDAAAQDPYPKLRNALIEVGTDEVDIMNVEVDIKKLVDSSSTTVSRRLKELEDYGLVSKNELGGDSNMYEYSITEEGLSLSPIMQSLFDWVADRVQ